MTSKHRVNPSHNPVNIITAVAVLAGGLMLSACTGNGSVNGQVDVIDLRKETLLSTDLKSVNGTYGAGCVDRTGSWSLEIEPDAGLDHAELTVVLNNTDCVLRVTELVTIDGPLAAVPGIALTTSYKLTPSEFDDPVAFYANAKLSAADFASDFIITILYSDDPALATDNESADFTEVEASAVAMGVPAPDYGIDLSPITLSVDAGQVVQSAGGLVALTENSVIAEEYLVVDAAGLDTYAELDAAYEAGSSAPVGPSVPVQDFDLVGDTLPQVRTLIFVNIEHGVRSYQAFEITFNPAA